MGAPGWYQGAAVSEDGGAGPDRGCLWGLFRAPAEGAALQLVALVEPSGIGGWLWTVPIAGLDGPVGSGATALQAMDLACSALVRAAAAPRAMRNDRHALRLLERWRSGGPKQQGTPQPAVRPW